MKLTKHNDYKSVEMPWLDKIPSNWDVFRVKDVVSINSKSLTEKTEADYLFKYIDIGNVNVSGIISEPETTDFESAPSRARRIVKKNDVIISTVRTYLKAVAFFKDEPKDVIVSTGFAVLSANKKIDPNYLAYLVRSEPFIDNVIRFSIGVSYPAINTATLASLPIYSPDKFEQKVIAKFLDQKTTAIDKKISALESKVNQYKELDRSIINEVVHKGLNNNVALKDSGIEWIGEIPKHWNINRIKDSFTLFTGNSISDKTLHESHENSWFYISTKDIDIDTSEINYDNGVYISKGDKSFRLAKANSTLICVEGANAGKKIGFTAHPLCFVNKLCCIKSSKRHIWDKFFFYFTKTPIFEHQFFSIMNGLIGGVSFNLIKNFDFIIPPIEEQIAIAEHLDKKTKTIDDIVANIKLQIDNLKELRKTLINDVVIGKLKVTV